MQTVSRSTSGRTGIIIVVTVVLVLGGWIATDVLEARHIERQGVNGVARILSYEGTGIAVNDGPRMRFQLEIQPEGGGEPFRVEITRTVTTMDAPRLQPGTSRKVRYLPKEPNALTFTD